MDCTIKGDRYEEFFTEIPYTVWGGAWIDDLKEKRRFFGPSIRVESIPFSTLLRTLDLHLRHFHDYLSHVTEEYVMACGRLGNLGSPDT